MGKWRRKRSLPRRWHRKHLITKYGPNCYLCKEPILKMGDITIDHWVPISKGGQDQIQNYRIAHDKCNKLKSDMDPKTYMEFQIG